MRHSLIPLLGSLFLLGGASLFAAEVAVENPGFETGNRKPDGWAFVSNQTPLAKFNWVAGSAGQEVHEGFYAVQIQNPPAGSSFNRWQQNKASRFPVTASVAYTIRCWVKGERLDPAQDTFKIGVEWWDVSGEKMLGTWISQTLRIEANDTWQSCTVTTRPAPAGAVRSSIQLFFLRSAESASELPALTFDAVSVATEP